MEVQAESAGLRGGTEPRDPEPRLLEVRQLGFVEYGAAVGLQESFVNRRRAGSVPDQLLLLQHPHVITLGSSSRAAHVLVDDEERQRLGIQLFRAGRGGDVTYHGPGQLVGYPILDLKPDRKDVHRYLRDLEEVLIRTVATFGVEAERCEGLTGVWVQGRKLGAIGVRVSSRWITSHGFALNVCPELSYFQSIVPCGIRDREVTSLSRALGRTMDVGEVVPPLLQAVSGVLDRTIVVV